MAFFNEDWLQELFNRLDIVDLVNSYVPLKNKSGRWWGCCPFHNEKTPSFTVNPERGYFHCFGCGKGGNAIHFVMELEKMTFPEACAYLGEKVNLPMPENTGNADYERKKELREKIYEMNRIAAGYFHQSLLGSEGETARRYLAKRGFGGNVIKTFGMGFAPAGWDNLMTLLEKKGFTKQEMQLAGLIKLREAKSYDVFRNRLMLPIINSFSKVIGFGGRVLLADDVPKYLNSQETAAFNKSRNLYNLNLIRKLKNLNHLILVEGYMDVVALHAAGIQESVATLGTALTQEQARLLKRYTKNVYLSYDGDSAGQKATLRAVDILSKEGIESRVITIPGGQDPDDFLKRYKKDGYLKLLKAAKPVLDYKFDLIAAKYDMEDGYQKEKYAKECVEILKKEESAIVREKYVRKLSQRTGFSEQAILQDANVIQSETTVWKKKEEKQEQNSSDLKAENRIVQILSGNPQYIEKVKEDLSEEEFENEVNRKIFSYILMSIKKGISPTGAELLSVLESKEDISHLMQLLDSDLVDGAEEGNVDGVLGDCIKRVKIRNKDKERRSLLGQCAAQQDAAQKSDLMNRIDKLQKEIYVLRTSL